MKNNFKLIFLFILSFTNIAFANSLKNSIKGTSQIIIVSAENENSKQAEVEVWEKKKKRWNQIFANEKAMIGRNGLATGLSLYSKDLFVQSTEKKEGDGRTPTGVFEIGQIYGEAKPELFLGHLSYTQSNSDIIGVDDSKSKYYNQIIKKSEIKTVDWNSFEEIYQPKTNVYRWLLEIKHNPQNTPGRGSLIFFHVQKDESTGTAGCVALEEKKVVDILSRLQPSQKPRIVILEQKNLALLKKKLGLIK